MAADRAQDDNGVSPEPGLGPEVGLPEPPRHRLPPLLRLMRPQQWAKNLLLAVPLVTSHRIGEPELLGRLLRAFVTFSLTASAVYVLNDLLDIPADRRHPTKRWRPLAEGTVTIPWALAWLALLTVAAAVLCLSLPARFGLWVGIYAATTTLYSAYLKRKVVVDVLCLAGLYTMRIVVGGEAVGVEPSGWLLAFSLFLFLSLAYAKRFTELAAMTDADADAEAPGRGYRPDDLDLIRTLGPTSGYIAVMILTLYIRSPEVVPLYRHPEVLWLACPVLLYWITRLWFLAQRRYLPDDPVVFALKDLHSYVSGAILVAILFAAT